LVVALVAAPGLGGAASAAAGGSLSDLQSGLASCSGTPGTPYAVVLSADLSDPTAALAANCDARIDLRGHDLTVGHVVIAAGRSLEVTDTTPAASGPDPDANAGTLTADSSDASGHAGIQTTGATLITSGTAQVVATGGAFSAGIGGTYNKAAGGTTTSKDSSTITASGGRYGAGIGGSDLGAGGTTTSNDSSTITATGGGYGAGIGGGDNGAGGTTTSNDSSTITATGGYAGPGIGGGLDATDAGITKIQGGSTIDAKGGTGGSDIGLVGDDVTPSSGTFLTITNGTLLVENHLVVLDDGHPSADVVIEGEGRITQSPGALISGSGLIENRGAIRIPTAQVDPTKVSVHHYLVSFDTNGGSAAPAAVTVFADTFTHGDRTLPADPTKVGATFTGWNTAADGSGDDIDADAVLPGASSDGSAHPVTLYAQYDEATTPVLTVTASSPSITAGSAIPAITPSYSGFVNGDGASVVTAAPTCSTTATASSPVGDYPTTCTGGTVNGYTFSYVAGTLHITAAPVLTVTASSPAMVYGGAVPVVTPSYSGFAPGDDAAVVTTAPTCSTTATASSPVGNYPTTCTGGTAAGYTLSYAPGSLQVAAAPLSVTASSPSITYGSAVPTIAPSYSGFVNGDNVSAVMTAPTCSTTATSSSPVGSYPTSCAGGAAANYTLTHADGSLQVAAAPLVVTASSGSMVHGSTPPLITPSYSGFVNGDDTSVVSDLPTCSTTATSSSPVGSYPTSCAGGAAPNYTLTHADGTLQVTPATITGLAPSITGRAQVRQVLRADPGPVDPATVALTYLWRADGVAIPGAVSSTLRLTRDLAGARIRVRITATYPGRDPAVKTSAATPYVREFVKRARVGLGPATVCSRSGTVKGLGQGLVPGDTYTIQYLRTTIKRTADEYGEVHFPVTIPAGTNSGPQVVILFGFGGKEPTVAVGIVRKLNCVH
jgi:hypothetical protein